MEDTEPEQERPSSVQPDTGQQELLLGLREELAAEYPHLDEATIQQELDASRGTRLIVPMVPPGDEVRVSSEPPPVDQSAPSERVVAQHNASDGNQGISSSDSTVLPARIALAALVKNAVDSTDPAIRRQAADCYVACVESCCEAAATLGPGDPVAEQRLRDAEEVMNTDGETLRNAGVPRCDDVTNGRLCAKLSRLRAVHTLSLSDKPKSRGHAARALVAASKAIKPVLRLELSDHVALAAIHSMQACLNMKNSSRGSRAPVQAEYAVQHARAAANVALTAPRGSKVAAHELRFLSTKLAESRLPLSAAQMEQHAHCIEQRLPIPRVAHKSDTPKSGSATSTGPHIWCQCDACTESQRTSRSFARLAAPTIPRGSVTVVADADLDFTCNDKLVVTNISHKHATAGVKLGMQLSAFHGAGAQQHWVLSEKEMKEFTTTRNGMRNQTSTATSSWKSFVAKCEASPRPWTFTFTPLSQDQPLQPDFKQSSQPRRKTRRRSRPQRRPLIEADSSSVSRAPTPPPEQQHQQLWENQATAAALGTAAGVSTFVDETADVDVKWPPQAPALTDDEHLLPWPQRKRTAVVRLQQQLSEAKKVLAQHQGIGRLMSILESERNHVNRPQSGQDGGHQEEHAADDASDTACPAPTDAPQDADPGITVDLSALQSELQKSGEQQSINDAVQTELAQRVERLQVQLDKDAQEEAEQRKIMVEIRARVAQQGKHTSKSHRHVAAGGPHPTAYSILEKSLQQHDIILKQTVARSQALQAQLTESRETIKTLKISNKRLQDKSLKSAKDLKLLQQQQNMQLAQSKKLLAAADHEKRVDGGDQVEFKVLIKRLEEAEQALADQSSGEEMILQQLASLTSANEAAKAADVAREKLVGSLKVQLKNSKHTLKAARLTSKRERERLQRTNSELADVATSNARTAAAAKRKLREMEEQLIKVHNSQGQKLARATKELKAQAESLLSEKLQALEKVKLLQEHHKRGKSELKALQSELQDAKNEVAILQLDLTDVRARASEKLQEQMRAELDQARGETEESVRMAERKAEDARAAERSARVAAERQASLEQQNLEQQEALEKAQLALVDARRKQIDAERTAQALQASLTASDNERKQQQARLDSSTRDGIRHSMISTRTSVGKMSGSEADAVVPPSFTFESTCAQAGSLAAQNATGTLTLAEQVFSVPEPAHRDPTFVADQRSHKPKPPARPSTASAGTTDIIDCSSLIRGHGSGGSNSARRRLVPATSDASATIPSAATANLSECVSWGQAFSVVSDVRCRRPSSARRRLAPSEVSERAIYRFFVPPP